MKKNTVQKVKGVICTNWCDEFWTFTLVSRVRWDYDRMRHRLTCNGEQVADGIMCLGDAVIFAQGFEVGVAELICKGNKVLKDMTEARVLFSHRTVAEDFWERVIG